LLRAATGDALVELRQLEVGNDAVLCQPGSGAPQVAGEILATPQAFVCRFRGSGDPQQGKTQGKTDENSTHSRLLREYRLI
jgi:hypothetical protein